MKYARIVKPVLAVAAAGVAFVVGREVIRRAGVEIPQLPGTAPESPVPFAPIYQNKDGTVRSRVQQTYDVYKKALGPTTPSSKVGGTKVVDPLLSQDEFLAIFDGVKADLAARRVDARTVNLYRQLLAQAFRIMKIDTAEAQAAYMGNAYLESDQFRYMTETEKATKNPKPYREDPKDVSLDTAWLDKAAAGGYPGIIGYEKGGTINPLGDWNNSFIGRGPIQVTHKYQYVHAIANLENRAEELEREAPGSSDAKALRSVINRLKQSPQEGSAPRSAFLLSAGFMKQPFGTGRGDEIATRGNVTSWMGSQPAGVVAKKQAAYQKALSVLKARAKA